MKTLFAAVGCAAVLAAPAYAELNLNPYVGLNLAYSNAQLNHDYLDDMVNENHMGIDFNIGVQFNQYFAVEGFIQKLFESDKVKKFSGDDEQKIKTSAIAYGVDAIGSYPISDSKFSVLGTLGLGYYDMTAKLQYYDAVLDEYDRDEASQEEVGFRFGIGAQYAFSEKISARIMARYIMLNSDEDDGEDLIKGFTEISLGARYNF